MRWIHRLVFVAACSISTAAAQWVQLSNIEVKPEDTELGGRRIRITYELVQEVTADQPVYVFVRYRPDPKSVWTLLPHSRLRGNGFDIVTKSGTREIVWWGIDESGPKSLEEAEFRLRGIQMCRVAAGKFNMKSIPGQGRDESETRQPTGYLPGYYLAKNETTIQMYLDYLNETRPLQGGWNEKMANPERCGIQRLEDNTYQAVAGRENHPVTYVSWYDSTAFLQWCGLRLPSEAEIEKAIRGGLFLDGDDSSQVRNRKPDRRFPWGDEEPNHGGKHRCNYDGPDDGYESTAPVGSFSDFNSPYAVADLVGNVAEWTLDWYTTSYHAGLDGFRVVRGGSWMDPDAACDAISGATQLPLDESGIIGFRGAR